MNKDFYQTKIKEINDLISTNEIDKALQLLAQELSMPYIPEKYEEEFNQLYQILINKKFKKDLDKPQTITQEQFLEYLNSNDKNQTELAISYLDTINLHNIKKEIKYFIEKDNNKDYHLIKIFLIEHLIEQNVDIMIDYQNHKVNLKNSPSIFSSNEFLNKYNELNEKTQKNPSIQNIAFYQLNIYVLNQYWNIDWNKLSIDDLLVVSHKVLDDSIKLNSKQEELKKNLNTQEIKIS